MKTFHITWIINQTTEGYPVCTGVNVHAQSFFEALKMFQQTHPGIEPIYIIKM